jgi:hypothetical protein
MGKLASETRRAQRLLLAALRAPDKLPALPLNDWELLLRVARRARLLGRVEADLSRMGLLENIPPRAAAHLRAARNVIEHRKTLVSWEVNRLLWALKGIDVSLILLKGTAYVLADLPPANGRIFADVDLLVPEELIGRIEEKLIERGWFKMQIDPYDERYYRVWMHEIPPCVIGSEAPKSTSTIGFCREPAVLNRIPCRCSRRRSHSPIRGCAFSRRPTWSCTRWCIYFSRAILTKVCVYAI